MRKIVYFLLPFLTILLLYCIIPYNISNVKGSLNNGWKLPAKLIIIYKGAQYPFKIILSNGTSTFLRENFKIMLILSKESSIRLTLKVKLNNTVVERAFEYNNLKVLANETLFIVEPKHLKEGTSFSVYTYGDLTLVGEVEKETLFPTAKPGVRVQGISVSGWYYRKGMELGPVVLGYDRDSGILVHWGMKLIDPLLMKMGVREVWGGMLILEKCEGLKLSLVTQWSDLFTKVIWLTTYFLALLITFILLALYKRKKVGRQ